MDDTFDALADALLDPACYSWRPASVTRIVTHVSVVFLAGDRVLKIKRPVDLGFIDHRDPEVRQRSCNDEVDLNRRLAPDVYLGVVSITSGQDGFRVGGSGCHREWGVLMRRLPDNRMLDRLFAADAVDSDAFHVLALRLARFHQDVERCGPRNDFDCAMAQAAVLGENLDALARLALGQRSPGLLASIDRVMRPLITPPVDLLQQRCAEGWVRDGHGDLRAEHVCLPSDGPPLVYDCVEFSEQLRCADVASDLSFLLMDLDRLGAGQLRERILTVYRSQGFVLPDRLIRLYTAHRALVRAKVAAIEWEQEIGDGPSLERTVAGYIDLAAAATLELDAALLLVSGLSGCGKSFVADRIGRALGAHVLASDRIRRELQSGLPLDQRYDPAQIASIYDELFRQGRVILQQGQPVVLDATFLNNRDRTAAAQLAVAAGVRLAIIDVECSGETALRRIHARRQAGTGVSDADERVYRMQQERRAAFPPLVPQGSLSITLQNDEDMPPDIDPVIFAMEEVGLLQSRIAG
jgi:uncharacterized protein